MKEIITPEFRVSYPNLFEPRGFDGSKPKYSVVMLFDKTTDISELKKLAQEVVLEKYPDGNVPKGLHNPFRDGDEEKGHIDGYSNVIFVRAATERRPHVYDRNLKDIMDTEDIYAGCYARAKVNPYWFDAKVKKGITFGLISIQKTRDGDRFGSGTADPLAGFTDLGGSVTTLEDEDPSFNDKATGNMFD